MYMGAFPGGDNADFRITCGQREFIVHKMIICADSHYFKSVCKGNFEVKLIAPYFTTISLTSDRNKTMSI